MAIVQKIPPADIQNYFGWSHPISDVPPDKSTAILIEGLGGAATDAVKAYETVKKEEIQSKVEDTVYPAREKEINTLLDIREGLRNKGLKTGDVEDIKPPTENAPAPKPVSYAPEIPGSPTDIRYGAQFSTTPPGQNQPAPATSAYAQAGPDETPPEEVNNLPAELDARKASLDQNKISRTEFMRDMMLKAQQMRSDYPKFRDVVDAQFARILQTDPANATMSSAIRDINSMVAQTQRSDPVLQDLRWANKQGFPNADTYLKLYNAGKIGADDVNEYLNKNAVQFYQQRLKEGEHKSNEADRKDRESNATDRFRAQGGLIATNYFKALRTEAGVNTPEEMLRLVTGIQNGTVDVKSEQVVVLANAIRAAKVNAYQQMIEYSRMQPQGGGRTIEMDIGPEKVKKEAEASLQLFDESEKLITDKQVGAAFMAQQLAEAIGHQGHLDLLRDQNMGAHSRMLQSMRKVVGDNYLGQFAQRHITRGTQFTAGMNAWITANENAALAPPDLRQQSGLDSLKTAVDKTQRTGVNNPKIYDSLLDITKQITNPELKGPGGDQTKVNAANWAFDPVKNKGLFQKFAKDSVNTSDGTMVPGAFRAFQKITTPEMAQEINRLDGTPTGKGLKQKYINFVQTTAGVDLLRSEFNTLDQFFNDPNFRTAYNKGTGQFEVHYVPQSRGPAIDALRLNRGPIDIMKATPEELRQIPSHIRGTVDAAIDSFTRVNMGFSSLKSVANSMGLDANGFALQTMAAGRQGGDLPKRLEKQLEDSIINSQGTSIKGDKGTDKKPNPSGGNAVKTESYKKPAQ